MIKTIVFVVTMMCTMSVNNATHLVYYRLDTIRNIRKCGIAKTTRSKTI